MDNLEKLFGSSQRVKIMRLFLYNNEEVFEASEIRQKSQISAQAASRELARLASADFIKQKTAFKKLERKLRGKTVVTKRKIRGWILNKEYTYIEPLKNLLISNQSFERDTIKKRFKKAGNIKLLIISGIFLHNEYSRVDLLVVGDNLKGHVVSSALKALESGAGKELRFSILETKDFLYRLGIYDKFVRDILDYPHEKLIDKFGLR